MMIMIMRMTARMRAITMEMKSKSWRENPDVNIASVTSRRQEVSPRMLPTRQENSPGEDKQTLSGS